MDYTSLSKIYTHSIKTDSSVEVVRVDYDFEKAFHSVFNNNTNPARDAKTDSSIFNKESGF